MSAHPAGGRRAAAGTALGALLGAAVTAELVRKAGPVGLVAPLALVAFALALARPAWLAGLLVGIAIIVEQTSGGILPTGNRPYDPLISRTLSPLEILFVGLFVAVVLERRAAGLPLRLPSPFSGPLAFTAVALVVGTVVGRAGGTGVYELTLPLRPFIFLLLLPLLVANVADRPGMVRRGVLIGAALALVKAVSGLLGLATGHGATELVAGGTPITYYEPAANLLTLWAVLLAVASLLRRLSLARWARWGAWVSLACLVLSYRRSFYLALVLGLIVVVVLTAGPIGRRLFVPVALLVALGGYAIVSGGVVTEVQGPVAERVSSLQESKVTTNPEDRYRLDERRNVVAELRDHPFLGLGLGVPWAGRYPLSVEHPNGRQYVHMALLWWWLKLGVLGPIAYLWLMLTIIITGVRVWLHHRDDVVRCGALALAAATAGLVLAELTASFTGVDLRLTIVLGAALGLLSAARAELPDRRMAP